MNTISITIPSELLETESKEIYIQIEKSGLASVSNSRGETSHPSDAGANHQTSLPAIPAEKQNLFAYMTDTIDRLRLSGRSSTANNYESALSSFCRFLEGRDIRIADIKPILVQRYESRLRASGIRQNTVAFYMRTLRAVYNRAISDLHLRDMQPFGKVNLGIEKTIKRALPAETLRAIKCFESDSQSQRFARDMFLFSLYTRGMSFVDMAYLRQTDLQGGMLTYRRQKTGQLITMRWEPCMQQIADLYPPVNNVFLLPIVKDPDADIRKQYKSKQFEVNFQLHRISDALSLCRPLTMYVARHSWASLAKSLNVPMAVISESMGHTSLRTTQIYLSAIDHNVIDNANQLVLSSILLG
ncbi:MAG: site-specific integrase [Prevotellaceae bacterium]|nr:site-specific integrase [Prevotellaceae bacterium]